MKMIMLLMMALDGTSNSAPDVQLLDFSAGYCGPCQQMVPVLQRMEHAGYPIRQIDITEDPELAKQFKVDFLPTFVLMVEGKEVKRFVGLRSENELRQAMNTASAQLSEKRKTTAAASQPKYVSVETETDPSKNNLPSTDISTAERADVVPAQEKRSLGDMFRRMIGKGTEASESPSVRGQDPASNGDQASDHLKAAFAATVRIRVAGKSTEDGKYLQDVGTGTIVHSVTGQAIVLTCAHLFLNIAVKEAVVEVEVFEDGKPVTYPAKLVGGDHDADLALLQIQTSKIFPAATISGEPATVKPGQPMFSFGCNDGADPTRLDSKLVEINRYHGPPNFVCTVDPVSGRSGGGLFSASGDLLGVCSCADRKTHEGLYAAHGAILELVDYCKMKQILKSGTQGVGEDSSESFKEQMKRPTVATLATEPAVVKTPVPVASQSDSDDSSDFVEVSPDALLELPDAPVSTISTANQPSQPFVATPTTGPQITIVIDDKTPGAEKRVIVIPQASAWMLEMLTGETDDSKESLTTTLRPVRATAKASR